MLFKAIMKNYPVKNAETFQMKSLSVPNALISIVLNVLIMYNISIFRIPLIDVVVLGRDLEEL